MRIASVCNYSLRWHFLVKCASSTINRGWFNMSLVILWHNPTFYSPGARTVRRPHRIFYFFQFLSRPKGFWDGGLWYFFKKLTLSHMELLLLLIKLCSSVKQMVGTQQHKRIPPVILFWHHVGTILYATFAFSSIIHLICPPPPPIKFCMSIVFNFSWDGCNTQEKWKTKVMQNFGSFGSCSEAKSPLVRFPDPKQY